MDRWVYFLLFLKASALTFGGMSNLAPLQHDLPASGWAQAADFSKAVAIGQTSPGPNGLWVVSLGYLTGGLFGAAAALVAVTIPPFLILPLNAFYHRLQGQRWVDALMHTLTLVSVGLLLASAWSILHDTLQDRWSVPICLVVCALCMSRRLGALSLILLAAGAGLVLYFLA
jgi:chromate transporter